MRTHYKTCGSSPNTQRRIRSNQVLGPVAGQFFEINISHEGGRWIIRIPEIDDATEAGTRAAVESAARECIAARTGIPIGYISVWVSD